MSITITRRNVMEAIGLAAAATPFSSLKAQTTPTVSFMAIGDWGRQGEPHQRGVADEMGRLAAQIGSRFTLALGDNFYNSGVQSVEDPLWKESFENVYTAPSLQHRWYAILGNHDYKGNPQAQIDYSRTSPRWTMPGRYYVIPGASISVPNADIFMIDTAPLVSQYRKEPAATAEHHVHDQNADAQYAWLDKALGQSKADWKLVFGHHPVFSGGQHGDSDDLIVNLLPILKRHGVQAYVCGHDHDMQHIHKAGMHFIATGCGSTVRPVNQVEGTRFAMSRSGLSLWRLGAEQLDFAFYDWGASKVYEASILRDGGEVAPAKPKSRQASAED
ncbi:tartrate-resistant acid phosphatase type 5 family protein [Sphingomonas sp. dw_22]|uniref:purple acid phosphatase family protein n=1 Tax=Sphingomonas sp. dw_22 TaxID=2721175 RepID=UPI001BD33E95|nr:tartrate-resistant acid phosphatase type 5 family protein [Sphingomonas sp. dw_22]